MEQAVFVGAVECPGEHTINYYHGPGVDGVWYKAVDIMEALGLVTHSASMAVRKLPDAHKQTWLTNDSPTLLVSGVGMVELIMRSRAPNAARLRGWARAWLQRTSGGQL